SRWRNDSIRSRISGSSSMTSTVSRRRAGRTPDRLLDAAAGRPSSGARAGRRTTNVEPLPGSLVTAIVPAICSHRIFVIDSPSPVPALLAGGRAAHREEGLNRFFHRRGRHAGAGARPGDRPAAAGRPRPPLDLEDDPAVLGELAGVAEQVQQDLPQPGLVGTD